MGAELAPFLENVQVGKNIKCLNNGSGQNFQN